MSAAPKQKFPRAAALAVAKELCAALQPAGERLIVAGSLRRGKAMVGDVEIVYVSRTVEVMDGLFDVKKIAAADDVLINLVSTGVLGMRQNIRGSTTWGEKNKLAVHVRSGIPVDLFATSAAAWWNYLVCRTGSAENNVRISEAARAKGWKWHPYGAGFTDERGNLVPVQSERDVFEMVGLEYRETWERE